MFMQLWAKPPIYKEISDVHYMYNTNIFYWLIVLLPMSDFNIMYPKRDEGLPHTITHNVFYSSVYICTLAIQHRLLYNLWQLMK